MHCAPAPVNLLCGGRKAKPTPARVLPTAPLGRALAEATFAPWAAIRTTRTTGATRTHWAALAKVTAIAPAIAAVAPTAGAAGAVIIAALSGSLSSTVASPVAVAARAPVGHGTLAFAPWAKAARTTWATPASSWATLAVQFSLAGQFTTQSSAAGEIDAALRIDLDDHDGDFVADGDNVLGPHDLVVGQLGGAHQAFFAWQDFHEGSELDQAPDGARVDLANLPLLCQRPDCIHAQLLGLAGAGGDIDAAIILAIDLGAALLLNLANHLATRANDCTNLVRVNLDSLDARSVT